MSGAAECSGFNEVKPEILWRGGKPVLVNTVLTSVSIEQVKSLLKEEVRLEKGKSKVASPQEQAIEILSCADQPWQAFTADIE